MTEKTKKTVTKIANNKQAKQTDAESVNIQHLGEDMSAPNDRPTDGSGGAKPDKADKS